jgi:glutamine amidotransferase
MCRFLVSNIVAWQFFWRRQLITQVYKGSSPILLSSLILEPQHSILHQSYDSRLRLDHRRPHNGDGFGIGYYTSHSDLGPEPCVFKSIIPAWNCTNLERIASKTQSSLIFAHIRASTEGNLSEQNCHPFWCGSLMWMHNGGIGAWTQVKRRLGESIGDEWYNLVKGGTDSEWAFALFLDSLEKLGCTPSKEPGAGGFGHVKLRKAMLETIRRINALIAAIPDKSVDMRSLLNFAVTDGHSVICTRYINSKTDEAASLFWSSGTGWRDMGEVADGKKHFKMERKDKGADIVLVASEPLTFDPSKFMDKFDARPLIITRQLGYCSDQLDPDHCQADSQHASNS